MITFYSNKRYANINIKQDKPLKLQKKGYLSLILTQDKYPSRTVF
jgi:hypothetical protein